MKFGAALRKARSDASVTQKELCFSVFGKTDTYTFLSRIECGKQYCSIEMVEKFEKALNIKDGSLKTAWFADEIEKHFSNKELFKKAIMKIVAVFLLFLCISPITVQASTHHNTPTIQTNNLLDSNISYRKCAGSGLLRKCM